MTDETEDTTENVFRGAADLRRDWFALRALAEFGSRDFDGYDAVRAEEESFLHVPGEVARAGWDEIAELDRAAFGTDRGPLLRQLIADTGPPVAVEDFSNRVVGYAFTRTGVPIFAVTGLLEAGERSKAVADEYELEFDEVELVREHLPWLSEVA